MIYFGIDIYSLINLNTIFIIFIYVVILFSIEVSGKGYPKFNEGQR